jgi:hypothetical protein
MATQRPVMKFRAGPVSCALWENEVTVNGNPTPVLRATVERRYKDAEGGWRSSNSFSRNDLFLVVWCLQRALDVMIERGSTGGDDHGMEGQTSA